MNRKEYGEKIVNEIINDYKLSNDFRDDAVDYVYKEIFNKLNEICAQVGHDFMYNHTIDEGEFMKKLNNNLHLREVLDEFMKIGFGKITDSSLK